jgi:hypothetical protein
VLNFVRVAVQREFVVEHVLNLVLWKQAAATAY